MARSKGKLTGQQELGKVVGIDSAPSQRTGQGVGGGRPTGLGYDPASGETHRGKSKLYAPKETGEGSRAEVDVFSLVDEKGYRADRFYTRSTNQDGHGEKLQVRVPQGIDSQMHAAVSEIPEYRSLQDLARDAIVHRLEWLQQHYKLSDSARRFVELERHTADMNRITSEITTMTNAVDDLKMGLETAYASRDWGLMKEVLDNGDEMVEWMRDPYRARVVQEMKDWRGRVKEELEVWAKAREKESGE